MTDMKLATLYRNACGDDHQYLADIEVTELIDLANGRLAGERRARLVEAIAASPSLALAYRMAKASGDWSRLVAAELAQGAKQESSVRALPARQTRPAIAARRHRFAMAAAVSAMAIGAVFVAQKLESPEGAERAGYTAHSGTLESDRIMLTSFDSGRDADVNGDVIFTASSAADSDRIFAFGKGS